VDPPPQAETNASSLTVGPHVVHFAHF
jgi:hypothetical protein